MNVYDAILTKRAVRQFQDRPLPEEIQRTILNAGRRAQSSKNTQPWTFVAVRERATLQALSTCGVYAGHLAGASLGVVIVTPDPASLFSVMFDAGQAAGYMQLAAWELSVGSCLATIYEPDRVREILGFPADLHARIALSFGYALDEEKITQAPKAGGRRALAEVVRWEHW